MCHGCGWTWCKEEAGASFERRYYKRVPRVGATICWGVAAAIGLSLPDVVAKNAEAGRGVPVAQNAPGAPPPAQTTPATPQTSPSAAGASQDPKPAAPAAPTPPGPSAPSAAPATTAPPTPTPPRPLYERAWAEALAAAGTRHLTLTPTSIVISGPETTMEARALADGTVTWTADLQSVIQPVLSGELLVSASADRITATDHRNGNPRWSVSVPRVLALEIAADAVISADEHGLRALRLEDGAPLWQLPTGGDTSPIVAAGPTAVFAFAAKALMKVDLPSGRPLWQVPLEITPAAMTVTRDLVSLAAPEGFVCAYRTEEGGLEWCFNVRVRPTGAPLADGQHLYVAFLDGTIRMFDGHNGARRRAVNAPSRPLDGPRVAGQFIALPLVTSEFVLFDRTNSLKMTRVLGFDPAESPPTLHAAASAADGSVLAMLMTSPATTSLLCLRPTPEDVKPTPAGPDAAPPGAAPTARPAPAPSAPPTGSTPAAPVPKPIPGAPQR